MAFSSFDMIPLFVKKIVLKQQLTTKIGGPLSYGNLIWRLGIHSFSLLPRHKNSMRSILPFHILKGPVQLVHRMGWFCQVDDLPRAVLPLVVRLRLPNSVAIGTGRTNLHLKPKRSVKFQPSVHA